MGILVLFCLVCYYFVSCKEVQLNKISKETLELNYENEELLRFDVKQKKVRIDLGQVDLYGLGKYGKYKTIRFYKVSDDER